MCEYCGCHQNDKIGQFMEEHDRLMVMGDAARRCLDSGDVEGALAAMAEFRPLMGDLADHIEKENRGIFPFAYSAFSPEQWSEVDAAHEADHARKHTEGVPH